MPHESEESIPPSAMVVVAHPDDAEFMVAGTAAKWAAAGSEVTYVVITRGDKGSDDPTMTPSHLATVREAEQRAAGAILGVKNFVFMGYDDGYLRHTLPLRREVARLIRTYRPYTVVCFDPTNRFLGDNYVNHPDHRASGDVTVDAVFPTARDRLTFPELLADGLEPHKVKELWLGSPVQANVWVDIGPTLELKRQALLAHTSQIPPEMGPYADVMGRRSAEGCAFEFAEAFHRIIFDQPFVAPQQDNA